MRKGKIIVYYGGGKGKTCVAVGRGLRAIGDGLRVVMIQLMDYYNSREMSLLKKLEPDFRIFRFEKDRSGEEVCSAEVDSTVRKEISGEIRNAYNFAKKIVDTGECEMLMLDGVLECVEKDYIEEAELEELLERRPEYMDILMTGAVLPEELAGMAECVYQIVAEK